MSEYDWKAHTERAYAREYPVACQALKKLTRAEAEAILSVARSDLHLPGLRAAMAKD